MIQATREPGNKTATDPLPDSGLPPDLQALKPSAIARQVFSEHISFWLICGYLFFEYVRPQTIYPAIDFLPWTPVFAVGALLTSFASGEKSRPRSALTPLLVIYGCIVLLSSLFAYAPDNAFAHLGDYFNWLVIYFAIVRTVNTRARFFIFVLLYILCNLKMTQHGFLSWAGRGFAFDIDGVGGAPGWFQNSGEFGIQLCIFIPMVVAFIIAVRPYCSKLIRGLMYLAPITAIASIVASTSRGAMVGFVAAGVWAIRTSKYFIRTLLVGAILASAVYFIIPSESLERFENSGSDKTSLHRLDRWEKGWETMKSHPLLGVGHRSWVAYYRDHLDYGVPGTPLVHNIFVECGTENGFLGLGTLLLIILSMFRTNSATRKLASARQDRFSVLLAHGMDAATIGMVISSCFVTVLYYPYIWIHAAFIAALNACVQPAKAIGK